MVIQTARFGEITVDESSVIEIQEGLIGFPDEHRFCLLESKPGGVLRWLQSVDRGELAFLVANPYDFFADYDIYVDDTVATGMELDRPEDAGVLVLVSVQEGRSLTANLLGPVVVNTRTGRGRQLVLDGDRYTTRHVLASRERGSCMSSAA